MKRKPSVNHLIRNIPFVLSGTAVAALCTTSSSAVPLTAIMLAALVVVSMYLDNVYAYWKSNVSFFSFSISVVLLIVFGYSFYAKVAYTDKIQAIFAAVGVNVKAAVGFCALLGMAAGIYFLSTVISAVYSIAVLDTQEQHPSQPSPGGKTAVSGRQLLVILATAAAAVTLCSKSSPIYPFNDWVDSNCFMTVGRSMLHGLLPYRDLYEQKGPLLYMLHALGAMVSETTFIGVYFLEIIAAAVFLFFSFKLMKLYRQSASIWLVPILAAVVYSAASFCHGDSAEELCLPLFSFAVYLAVRSVRQGQCPTGPEYLAVGVTSACVLWIKYSMLGFYLGWFCVIAWQLIRRREAKKLLPAILWIGLGVLIPTVPILLYFGANHALADLWTVYFYNNLFAYSTGSEQIFIFSLARNLLDGLKLALNVSPIPAALIGTGLLALRNKTDRTEFFSYCVMGMFTFLLVYVGGQHHAYYALVFSVFVPMGLLSACQTLQDRLFSRYQTSHVFRTVRKFSAGIICAGSLIFAFITSGNTYLLNYSQSDLPQYQFAEIIAQKEDATLLNYGFLDGGFYTAAGIVPNCSFFCELNIELDEMTQAQDEYVELGQVDFVITRDEELESERYECIASTAFFYEGQEREYFLYQLIS